MLTQNFPNSVFLMGFLGYEFFQRESVYVQKGVSKKIIFSGEISSQENIDVSETVSVNFNDIVWGSSKECKWRGVCKRGKGLESGIGTQR